jgi:ABC-type transport system involved in multi-copper enzyme maturation permease subunit
MPLLFLSRFAELRHRRFSLVGPVFFYDLIRTARRPQFHRLRCLYAAFLLAMICIVYAVRAFDRHVGLRDLLTSAVLNANAMADLAATFFLAFLAVQFLVACFLTPAYAASAIPEYKESKTLEFLLSTDLHSREIVLGLGLSRLANLLLILLTGLPILALMQFLGGIDPHLLLFGFAFTGLTMLSLASLGILVSVSAPRPRHAMRRTYAWALAYLTAAGLSWLLLLPVLGWATWPSTSAWTSPFTLDELVPWLNIGNPIAVVVFLYRGVTVGRPLDAMLPDALRGYGLFHGLASFIFLTWAVCRLRAGALGQGRPAADAKAAAKALRRNQSSRAATVRERWARTAPLWSRLVIVGNRPMLWKELIAEPGIRLGRLGRISLGVLAPISFLPALGIIYYFRFPKVVPADVDEFVAVMNLWVRSLSTFVACGMLLGVADRAAESVSGERQRQTLDSLLTTSLSCRSILAAKWLGSIAGPRWAWLWLAAIWTLGAWTGGADGRAIPVLLLSWLTYAAFLASLGLWFSVTARSTQRALVGTLLAAVFCGVGHWVLWVIVAPVVSLIPGIDAAQDGFVELQALGLTPPLALAWLAFPHGGPNSWMTADWEWAATPLAAGLVFWSLAAAILGYLADSHFRASLAPAAPPVVFARGQVFRQRFRRLLRAVALPALLAMIIAAYASLPSAPGNRLREAVTEADRLDPNWRLDDLEASRPLMLDEQNGALQVPVVLDERTVGRHPWYPGSRWPSRELEQAVENLTPQAQLNHHQIALLVSDLEEVETALIQARRLIHFPRGRYPITFSKDGFSTLLPYAQRNRAIAGLLGYDALLRAQEGDCDGAIASCHAMIHAGGALGDEPLLISQWIRQACRALALARLERVLAQGQPSEKVLAALQRRLQEEEAEPVLLIGYRGQRAILDRFMETIVSEGVRFKLALIAQGWLRLRIHWLDEVFLFSGLSARSERAAMLRFLTRYVETAKRPPEEQVEALRVLAEQARQLPVAARSLMFETREAQESFAQMFARIGHGNWAQMRCAIVLVALERYRLRNERWPDSLEALVPAFLARVPSDPYDGRPLRYRRLADGVVVYSIGPDCVDDGGKLGKMFWPTSRESAADGTDIGFRLWDVARRRQPDSPQ